ncbi:MAG: histidine kinase dimerization/phosphoacceptor domain -containing protein, partial [Nitrososphaerales archaeon]
MRELAALFAVSAAINQSLTEADALAAALQQVLQVLCLDSGRIYLLNETTGEYTFATHAGDAALLDPSGTDMVPGKCLCGFVGYTLADDGSGVITLDPVVGREGCHQRSHLSACAAVPLLARDRTLGVLHVGSLNHEALGEPEMALLRSVGMQIGFALENLRLREEARRADALAALVQEMHHRIKNNLQTVADLLSLEMSASPSPVARKSLRDSVGRIKSIAAVHELLSLEQLRLTDITMLAQQVCDISLKHFVRPDRRIAAEITGPPIFLPSKQATSLALIINELVSNALEHAFPIGAHPCQLQIELSQEGPKVTLKIADSGRGLPPDFK